MSQHVEPNLLAKINDQQGRDGIDLSTKVVGDRVRFDTRNSTYDATKVDDKVWLLQGGTRWQTSTCVHLAGSTFGGSVIMAGWLREAMHVEIYEEASGKCVTTSAIVNLWEDG